MATRASGRLLGLTLLLWLGGCSTTTTIIPPAEPAEPVPVFVLDHGRHATLVLPHPEGMVRYAYGDWAWYAEVETGPLEAVGAVLFPSRSAFGRRVMDGPVTVEGVRRDVRVGIERLYRLEVSGARVAALRGELEATFAAGWPERVENRAYDLVFVPHPEPYTAFNNSNHMVARWLIRLGAEVRGSAFWSDWRVASP